MSLSKFAVFGYGGHGKVVSDAALCSGWNEVVFYDDFKKENTAGNFRDFLAEKNNFSGHFIAIGDNHIRQTYFQKAKEENISFETVIHPSSIISSGASIGEGSLILAGSVINTGSKIGSCSVINTSSIIEHDCKIGSFVHISPGTVLCGGVKVGDLSWVGANSTVKENTVIGQNSIVGAGSAVINSINSNRTVVGNPSREI